MKTAIISFINDNWDWTWPVSKCLVTWLALNVMNGLKNKGGIEGSMLTQLLHQALDRITVTSNKDAQGTFKMIFTPSTIKNGVNLKNGAGAATILLFVLLSLTQSACGTFSPAIAYRDGSNLAACGIDDYHKLQTGLYDTGVAKANPSASNVFDAIISWLDVGLQTAHCIKPVTTDIIAAAKGQPIAIERLNIQLAALGYNSDACHSDPVVCANHLTWLAGNGDVQLPGLAQSSLPKPSVVVLRRVATLRFFAHQMGLL